MGERGERVNTRVKAYITLALTLIALTLTILPGVARVAHAGGAYYTPITVTERSGVNLANYTVKITLNSTSFQGWSLVLSENGSDVYFTDANGNPLYYWIESFNKTAQTAVIHVKVPSIPANSNTTVYMFFGGSNPYTSYNNPSNTFLFYDDFTSATGWSVVYGTGSFTVSNGILQAWVGTGGWTWVGKSASIPGDRIKWTARVRIDSGSCDFKVGYEGNTKHSTSLAVGYDFYHSAWMLVADNGATEQYTGMYKETISIGVWYKIEAARIGSTVKLWVNGVYKASATLTVTPLTPVLTVGVQVNGITVSLDYLFFQAYTEPEPLVTVGSVKSVGVPLPDSSLLMRHSVVFSPVSSAFTYSFTAVNTSTAGYEVNYTSLYGWRVWVNPYTTDGVTYYVNNASLVSQVNVTLPYNGVYVSNLTFYGRVNGTGGYRQLWVRVLDSSGAVVAELVNASLGVDWTPVSLSIGRSLSGAVTLWFNATVASTSSVGEELAVRDVALNTLYNASLTVTAPLNPNVDYFNCTADFTVSLGNASLVNSSILEFLIVGYLSYNTTDYPVAPVYAGNTSLNGLNYAVYRVGSAGYTGSYKIYLLLENKIKSFRTRVGESDVDTVVVGENLTVELPLAGNISIPKLGLEFANTSMVNLSFTQPGDYTIVVNRTVTGEWSLGSARKTIRVVYGSITVNVADAVGAPLDYVNLTLRVSRVNPVVGNKSFSVGGLWAGEYTCELVYRDVVVWSSSVRVDHFNPSPVLNITVPSARVVDYRGLGRILVMPQGFTVQAPEDLSGLFPYSRMRLHASGYGYFKLYVDYRGDLPSLVSATGVNVSSLRYYWSGSLLVVEGFLQGAGDVYLTDLYRVRVELYDRLNRTLPAGSIMVSSAEYSTVIPGSVGEVYLYPGNYTVTVPGGVEGFRFYGWIGLNATNTTTASIVVNHTDVVLKAWYLVPTRLEGVSGLQVRASALLPLFSSSEPLVYVEGYLRDYYGAGVPGRTVVVSVSSELGGSMMVNATTDASGYFRTPLIRLQPGVTYSVVVSYPGDDVYTGYTARITVKPEELPVAPLTGQVPLDKVILGVAGVAAVLGVILALKHGRAAGRHSAGGVEGRRFVKRKS